MKENQKGLPANATHQALQAGFVHVILVLVIVAVAISGAYYFGTAKNKQGISQIAPTPLPSTAEAVVQEGTVDWKTYTDPDRVYSIKYPPSWVTKVKCNGGIPNDTYICLQSSDLEQNPVPAVQKGKLVIIDKPRGSSFVISDSTKDFCKETSMSKYKSCDKILINGITMVKKVWSNFSFIDVAILDLDGIAKVSVRLEYPYPSGYSGTDFDQILSTFKFTDQTNAQGKFCGGFAANLPKNQCQVGFYCKLDGNYPDASGHCIKK